MIIVLREESVSSKGKIDRNVTL